MKEPERHLQRFRPTAGRNFALDDRFALTSLLLVAAALRLAWLPDRGTWDADQGRDLLVLRALLADGTWPLVGPVTSIGGIHHGATYYYLLAPMAALGGMDPAVVALVFASAGVATVWLTWWLARSIGGRLAGLVAGLLMALSPTAIAASVTIWNPNLVAPAAALALAAAWRAWSSRQPRWWILALGATGLTAQLHVVASVLVLPILALLAADLRRTPRAGRPKLAGAVLGGLVVVGVVFVPLIAHELGSGFGELRAAFEFIGGQRAGATLDPAARLLVAAVRMASWPVVGLIVDAPVIASLVTGLVAAVALWRWRASEGNERTGTRWLVATFAVSAAALALIAPDLATVVRGLPNDQYHAFTDPIIPVLLGLGVAGLAGPHAVSAGRRELVADRLAGRLIAVALVGGLVVAELTRLPSFRDPDGGWPAARAAAERVVAAAGDRGLVVVGLPGFKPTDGFVFPLLFAGGSIAGTPPAPGALVIVCDRLFEPSIGAACGGEAERAVERDQPGFGRLVDRFDLSKRSSVSVYLPAEVGG